VVVLMKVSFHMTAIRIICEYRRQCGPDKRKARWTACSCSPTSKHWYN